MNRRDVTDIESKVKEQDRGVSSRSGILRICAVIVFFLALTIWMTWPQALHMGDAVVGSIGDNIYFVWMIGWVKKALFELGVNPFNVWFLNYPEGWSLAYTEITPAQLALALPFALLGGETFGYNAAMLLSFVLSGLGMYLWVRRLTGRSDAALIAGTIFAFVPYRFAHYLIGHLNLIGTQWFPFFFMGLYDLLEARRFAPKAAVLTGVSLGLIALTSQYYLYMGALVTAVMLFVYLIFLNRAALRSFALWKNAALAGLAALPLVLLAVVPFLALDRQGGLADRGLGVVMKYSASPTDFFLPSTDHFAWGAWVGRHFNREMWVEATLYIGAVALALAVAAWFTRRRAGGHPRLLAMLLWGGLAAFILAMGIDLHWLGAKVEPLALPGWLASRLGRETLPLHLPGYYLFHHFPFYAKLRALMRFGVFVLVFASASAGLGAAWLLARARRFAPLLAVGLLLLVFLDFYPGSYRQFAPVTARPVDAWLAEQPGDGALAQFPFAKSEDQEMTYYTLAHGKPFIGGFFNAFPPPQYARIKPVLENFPDIESVVLLKELGVRWVLMDAPSYQNDLTAARASCEGLGLIYAGTFGDQWVFELPDGAP